MRVVIVGGGIAGTTCAEELRKRDANAEITIISEEVHPLYSRVLLPHYIKGKVARERVFLKLEGWYEKQNIEWLPGERVQKMDGKNKFVELGSGRELPFDKLLLATGGQVKILPEDVRGVSYLSTLDDADHLIQLLSERKASDRAGIYGGGFIACEYLSIFSHFHIPTTMVFRSSHVWSRVFDSESGSLIEKQLKKQGVEVISEAVFEQLFGEKELEGFQTTKGKHLCQVLGVGIGTISDLSWIREGHIEVKTGIKTNEFLETNIPDVYAAGDSTEFFDVISGHHRLGGNWMNAQTQGRIVAQSMCGERALFRLVSSHAINVLGLEVIYIGDTDREWADKILVQGSVLEGGVAQLFLKNNRVIGATLVGRNRDRPKLTKMINEEI